MRDAYYRERKIVEEDFTPYYSRVCPEPALPIVVTYDRNRLWIAFAVIVFNQRPTGGRVNAKHGKIIA